MVMKYQNPYEFSGLGQIIKTGMECRDWYEISGSVLSTSTDLCSSRSLSISLGCFIVVAMGVVIGRNVPAEL